MVINGYLLLDFFVSEVNGPLFAFLVFAGTAGYVAFILYLISHGGGNVANWFNLLRTKGYSYAGQ